MVPAHDDLSWLEVEASDPVRDSEAVTTAGGPLRYEGPWCVVPVCGIGARRDTADEIETEASLLLRHRVGCVGGGAVDAVYWLLLLPFRGWCCTGESKRR